MPVMPDWGGGGSSGYQRGQDALAALRPKPAPAPPRAIARPKPPPAPYQGGSGIGYIAPVQNYIPWTPPPAPVNYVLNNQPAVSYPTNYGTGGGGAVSGGGGGAVTTQAAVQEEKPVKKTTEDFAKLYDTNDELAKVDSAFAEQRSLYAGLLKKYLADHTIQENNVKQDARLGRDGVAKNKNVGLTSLNEDFAARGLGYSGIQAKEHGNAVSAYDKQKSNIDLGETRSLNDLSFRKNKYVGENGENGSNMGAARREAYARLVAKQDIV